MRKILKNYWFLFGLLIVFTFTLADPTDNLAGWGRGLNSLKGPDAVIFLVFLFSGFLLNAEQIRSGLTDLKGTFLALGLIFAVAPVYGALIGLLSLDTGIIIGLFLVAVMPTTLSSGVVMTGAAGGNPAHALFITVCANMFSVLTIALTLPLLLYPVGEAAAVNIDQIAVIKKISIYVLIPLCLGLSAKYITRLSSDRMTSTINIVNQCLILTIVWMGISQAKPDLFARSVSPVNIFLVVVVFHLMMLATAFVCVKIFRIPRGRMESVIFMGSQKTLPLSIILQVTLFPNYGQALIVCVLHHLCSLLIDGFLVGRLGSRRN